jgi:hypothetical protein
MSECSVDRSGHPRPPGDTALGEPGSETTPQPASDPPVPPRATQLADLGGGERQQEQAPGREEIEAALHQLLLPGYTYELRVPKYPTPNEC